MLVSGIAAFLSSSISSDLRKSSQVGGIVQHRNTG